MLVIFQLLDYWHVENDFHFLRFDFLFLMERAQPDGCKVGNKAVGKRGDATLDNNRCRSIKQRFIRLGKVNA